MYARRLPLVAFEPPGERHPAPRRTGVERENRDRDSRPIPASDLLRRTAKPVPAGGGPFWRSRAILRRTYSAINSSILQVGPDAVNSLVEASARRAGRSVGS